MKPYYGIIRHQRIINCYISAIFKARGKTKDNPESLYQSESFKDFCLKKISNLLNIKDY